MFAPEGQSEVARGGVSGVDTPDGPRRHVFGSCAYNPRTTRTMSATLVIVAPDTVPWRFIRRPAETLRTCS